MFTRSVARGKHREDTQVFLPLCSLDAFQGDLSPLSMKSIIETCHTHPFL